MIWAALAVALLVALPFVIEAARRPMTDAARTQAPGAFVTLSQGVTHYRWHGVGTGPVAVCVHGLTTPGFVWDGIAEGLVRLGFRVLVYDLYGRGFSDRPGGPQDHAFFQTQLSELLADQSVEEDITLIGYSMGGVIATQFAAQQPQRLRRLILLAPAGIEPVAAGLLALAARAPGLGRWLMLLRYPAMLRKGLRAEANQPSSVAGINARQAAELGWRGFVPAVHQSLRGILAKDMQAAHEQVRAARLPVLALWGEDDAVIPRRAAQTLGTWNPEVRTVVLSGAGHGLPYSHTSEVMAHVAGDVEPRAP